MPRNGSGNYLLPEPPFVPLTTISSAAMNSDLSDIASAMTASLARDGQGGMTAVLPLNAAGVTYTNDTNTGLYRTGPDAQAIKCGGSDIVSITTSGIDVTGSISQNGVSLLPVGLGPLPWSGTTSPSGWVLAYGQSLSRTTYSALWAFAQSEIALGNTLYTNGDGSTTFTVPDLRGRLPAGKDNMGGSAAGRLTSTTISPDGNTLGAVGGAQTVTLAQANLPNATLTVTASGTVTPTVGGGNAAAALNSSSAPTAFPSGSGVPVPPSNTFQGMDTKTVSSTGTTSSINGGVAQTSVSKVQPTIVTNYIIFAGV